MPGIASGISSLVLPSTSLSVWNPYPLSLFGTERARIFRHFQPRLVGAHPGRPAAPPTATGRGEGLLDRAVRHRPHGPGTRIGVSGSGD